MYNNEVVELFAREGWIEDYGRISVEPEHLKVKTWNEFHISYKSETEILPGGSLRIIVPHFFSIPQTDNRELPGYVELMPEQPVKINVEIDPILSCTFSEAGGTGRLGKCIFLYLPEGLATDKEISFVYGSKKHGALGTQAPPFAFNAYFLTAIDPDGKRSSKNTGYAMLRTQCSILVTGKKAAKATIRIPSVSNGKNMQGKLIVTDNENNIVHDKIDELSLLSTTPGVDVKEKNKF